jgi:hypothetical protein
MSPSSSPGGSPSASSFVDSSPLPSPSLQPLDLDRPPTPLGIPHPFAGSTHATTHPSNELRYPNSSYTPATWVYRPQLSSSADNAKVLESLFDEEEGFSTENFDPEPPDETTLWEERITRAVDTGEAEFTWKYVSYRSLPVNMVFTEPQEIRALHLYLHLFWNSPASGSYPSLPHALSSVYRPPPLQSSRRHIDHSLRSVLCPPGPNPKVS